MTKSVNKLEFDESSTMYIVRGISIISIISAHCSGIDFTTGVNVIFSKIVANFGTLGVGVLFFISGYYFFKDKEQSLTAFMLKKVKTIFVPWLIMGTIVYLYVVLRKGNLSLISWTLFLVGYQSYLYYLSVLIILYLMYFYLREYDYFIVITIVLSITSILLTSQGYLPKINPYLNFFNWIVFFALGLAMQKHGRLFIICRFAYSYRYLLLVIFIFLFLLIVFSEDRIGYWTNLALPQWFIGTITLLGFSTTSSNNNLNIAKIGKLSLSIYLIHMPIAGIIVNLSNKFMLWQLTLFRPFIVLFIVLGVIFVSIRVSKILGLEQKLNFIIGISKKL